MNSLNQLIEPGAIVLVHRFKRHVSDDECARFQCVHGFGLFPHTQGRGIFGQWLDSGDWGTIEADRITAIEQAEARV